MINNVILVGTISNDVVIRKVGELDVCNIVLRVQRNFREMDSNEYKCDFIPVTFWNVYALNIKEYCQKGDIVGVKGRIARKKSTINGVNYYSSEVIGERVIFIHLKSFVNQFANLKDKSLEIPDPDSEFTLEELKKIANAVDAGEFDDNFMDGSTFEEEPVSKKKTVKKKEK